MKKIILFLLSVILINAFSKAAIRRVGFFGPALIGVDYSDFQAAHDASGTGDTIMMMPGTLFSSGNTLSKKLVIIGPGYFLNQNAGLQANPLGMDSAYSTITISDAAASGSSFIGCTFSYNGVLVTGVNITDISFIRCWFNGTHNANNFSFQFNQNINNFMFLQCSFKGSSISSGPLAVGTNLSFINCLFYTNPDNYTQDFTFYLANGFAHSGLIQNCIFSFSNATSSSMNLYLTSGTWAINNSISNSSAFQGTGITYQNNIGTADQFPVGNSNQQNKTWANIFTLTGSQDGQFSLKAGSPAIGAGISGTNCGIFGGTTPYRLSGIPSVPTIYAITSPQGNTPSVNTVQINLSTRSNN
jgi:hypothetical protein